MKEALFGGVNAAALTAMNADKTIDAVGTAEHCRWLLANGSNNLAVLGTTGEANSLGLSERMRLLEDLVKLGVPVARLFPGTSTPNVPDTISLTQHAANLGCRGVLLLPPFYYKQPSEEGLYAFYSDVAEHISGDVGLYFYHFPQQSAVPITLSLIGRLVRAFPGKFRGIKDSTGNIPEMKAYIDAFASKGFEVYTGADAHLQESLKLGAAGCITATSNITSPLAARIYAAPESADASAAQKRLADIRNAVALEATIPAVKILAAHITGNPGLAYVRPPYVRLPDDRADALIAAYSRVASV